MAFTIIQNSLTADASEINLNFQHLITNQPPRINPIRMPMGEINLENTDSVYNIGSSTFQWEKIYIKNFPNQTISALKKIIEYEVSTATNRIEITEINGDSDFFYKLSCEFICNLSTTTEYKLNVNGDSGTTYNQDWIYGNNGTITSDSTIASSFISLGENISHTIGSIIQDNIFFVAKNINIRIFKIDQTDSNKGNKTERMAKSIGIWNDIVSTITSIIISSADINGIGIGSKIELWAPR
jgi:hypothetical protein